MMDEARTRGVRGWVRNLRDGRVEAVLEGPKSEVDALLAWCREGPPMSRVDSVVTRTEASRGEPDGFRVLATSSHPDA
jgi:acylphosphatase